jgi:hypothetical protein
MVSRPSAVRQDKANLLADLTPAELDGLAELDRLYQRLLEYTN